MAKYKDKWKTTFPAAIGNQTRPSNGVDNTQEYNTDGLPQYIANDPVRYDLQNAVNSQLVSNDERLNEKINKTSNDLAAHNKDPKAHATGISGNAATATKLQTPLTLSLTGKAAGSATFDGSSNASINVTSVNANTASKLSTARKINITGNATGAAAFDGTSDINISTTVNESKHAAAADNDGNGANIANTYLKKATVIDVIYPVGSIYMSMSATNPADLFGVGTWERISQGRMLLGADDSTYKAGATGGEATHTLTAEEMPAHSHSGTTSTNGNHTHGVPDCGDYGGSGNGFDSGDHGVYRLVNTTSAGNHNHTFTTDNSGGGAAHNNMSPYLVCYIWQRTA